MLTISICSIKWYYFATIYWINVITHMLCTLVSPAVWDKFETHYWIICSLCQKYQWKCFCLFSQFVTWHNINSTSHGLVSDRLFICCVVGMWIYFWLYLIYGKMQGPPNELLPRAPKCLGTALIRVTIKGVHALMQHFSLIIFLQLFDCTFILMATIYKVLRKWIA